MASLAQATREIRIGLKLLTASFVVIAIFFVFLKGGTIIKNLFFPTPPPPPKEEFGKLPRISFPNQNPVNIEYRINTLTGRLPIFPDRMKVYKIKKKEPSLVALQTVRGNLKILGFDENETKLSESTYQWNNRLGQTIQVNILTDNFKLSSNFLSGEPEKISGIATKKDDAYNSSLSFLEGLNQDTSDIDRGKSTLTYLKSSQGIITRADSQNEANLSRLDLFQKDLEKYKIYYPGLTESTMYFVFKNREGIPTMTDAHLVHLIADLASFSEYPIKTSDQAFADLKAGNSYVFNENKNADQLDITDVFLGYYIGQEDQQYFLPIIVFKGKGFTAYVQGVPDTSIGN